MDAVLSLFDLNGRLARSGFWAVYVGYGVYVFGVAAVLSPAPQKRAMEFALALLPAMLLMTFAIVRRLHDRGRSAWWALLFFATPLLVFPPVMFLDQLRQSGAMTENEFFAFAMVLAALANVPLCWGFAEIGFLKGTPGPNRYGPDPLSRDTRVKS